MRFAAASLLAILLGCSSDDLPVFVPSCTTADPLETAQIETIIAQAAARAAADGNAYIITVVNRDGVVVGSFQMPGAPLAAVDSCRAKARTAAFLSSSQHAFNTRTADFIIQDHFPPDLDNTPGGPLYGVQFSSLACSDVVGEIGGAISNTGNGLSGDFGSMPLYKNGCLVGGVAVDGGAESGEEERAAWAASWGYRPDPLIFGSLIFIDGIRLPFIEEMPPDLDPIPPYGALPGTELIPPMDAPPDLAFPMASFGGVACELRFPIIDSPMAGPTKLLAADVTAMFEAAAARSELTRAGIRRPLGSAARVFIAVTDPDGNILGCIRTPDATIFSFDVAIQKARTAAFFSSDTAALSTRAVGFLAQGLFPPGISGAPIGPLSGLQDAINPGCDPAALPLQNGITIFPGGLPLYKSGVLVGAIGVSGDGVDQDDYVASAGAELFPPPSGSRSDELREAASVSELRARLSDISAATADPGILAATSAADARLAQGLQRIRLPYVRFPRQPLR